MGEEVRLGRVRVVLLDERMMLLDWGVESNPLTSCQYCQRSAPCGVLIVFNILFHADSRI